MRILHTSDWHLGQKFFNQDRDQEHSLALNWLVEIIQKEKVECLLVSGDIFDTFNPPASAQELYYTFLVKLTRTGCRHVIITGGNHDSPSLLQAPKQLLKAMNVHVVGAADPDLNNEIIELKGLDGKTEALVAAVPFLRDRDLLFALSGESGLERIERIRLGIKTHFQKIGDSILERAPDNIPKLAMGHLFAFGAETSEKQDNIYIGDKANIHAEDFPKIFDYVALGHIHRPQKVAGLDHVRYSGSLIPLSFSEGKDAKSVWLLDFKNGSLEKVQILEVPEFRRLKSIRGSLAEIKNRLLEFEKRHVEELPPFVDIVVDGEEAVLNLDDEIRQFARNLHLLLLSVRLNRKNHFSAFQPDEKELVELDVLEVFQKKCEQMNLPEDSKKELEAGFRELLEGLEIE